MRYADAVLRKEFDGRRLFNAVYPSEEAARRAVAGWWEGVLDRSDSEVRRVEVVVEA